MADEKPFDATPARLARAKREGDVPRSRDVAAAASFACAGLALAAGIAPLASAASEALRAASRGSVTAGPYLGVAACVGGIVASGLVGGVGASVVQAGGPAFRFPAPSLKKLDPAAGLRRMFGRDAATGIAKALATATAVACATFPAVRDAFAANAANAGAVALVGIVGGALVFAFAGASATAVVFAAVDLALERAKWKRRLRMSFAELKRDLKQTEGDPLQRGRRRQAHRDLVRGSIGRLKDAAFVIANPTHVAIALEYAPPAVAVPRVLIRAVDAGARAVVERARILGVPVVRNVALARALLATAEVGRPIPRDQYGAVAFVVASLARAGALK